MHSQSKNVQHIPLKLQRLQGVRSAVHQLSELVPDGVDILIHCAGVCFLPTYDTEDGIEQTYQVNHFGPHLMTELLLPQLKRREGRVVFVGSKNANLFGSIELNSFRAGLSVLKNFRGQIISTGKFS